MSKLPITKEKETEAIAVVWNMALHSLGPELYVQLGEILTTIVDNRNLDRELLAGHHIVLSGKRAHASDCETSNSPALVPGPCDCDFIK